MYVGLFLGFSLKKKIYLLTSRLLKVFLNSTDSSVSHCHRVGSRDRTGERDLVVGEGHLPRSSIPLPHPLLTTLPGKPVHNRRLSACAKAAPTPRAPERPVPGRRRLPGPSWQPSGTATSSPDSPGLTALFYSRRPPNGPSFVSPV